MRDPEREAFCTGNGGQAPFVVAHRAGNRLADLLLTGDLAGVLPEADVRLRGGRVEVRHLRAAWPLPLLWDRWRVVFSWRHRLLLSDLVASASSQAELVIDLKGRRRRLAELVRDEIAPHAACRRFTVCARHWSLLDIFAELPVRRVHSVGTARQLRALLDRHPGTRLDGVSVHERLLDAYAVRALRRHTDIVMTWPVNRPERAIELLGLGIDGLITDIPARIVPCLQSARA